MGKRRTLAEATAKFESRYGRAPTEAELSREMGLEPAQFRELADAAQTVRQESLDEVYSDQSMWFADVEARVDDTLEREELARALAANISELPEREAMVLQLYFVEELNLEEIGEVLGVGAARICQIKKAALDRLRKNLRDWAD